MTFVLQELRAIEGQMAEGNLAAAQAECKRFLQQHPTHAGAHEMMGDILYARELWEEAAEWYELGRQLSPTEKLRIKRRDALRQAKQARKGPEPTLVDDADTPRRMIWLGIAAVAMLLVIVLVAVGMARRGGEPRERRPPRTVAERRPPEAQQELTSPRTVRGTPDSARQTPSAPDRTPSPTRREPAAQERAAEHWAAQQMERIPPRREISRGETTPRRGSEPLTDHDDAVVRAVGSLQWDENIRMTGQVGAMVDPFTGYAVLRVLVPQSVTGDLQEKVVRQAFRVAQATFQASEAVSSLTVQMVRDSESGERMILFRGNTTRRMIERVEETPDFDTLWDRVFTAVQWNPLAGPDAYGVIEDEPRR